jgi:O-antigen/teichoic acid export membrane protein
MNALLTRSRLLRLFGVASTQVLVQAIGFVSGIVLVRALSPTQYGYYTLAVALVGVANVLSELGVANAVMSIGGRLGGQRAPLRALVDDAHALQTALALAAPCVVLPVFVLMLRHQQASVGLALVLVGIGALNAFFNVRIIIAQSVARLAGHVALQQKADLAMNLARLALLGLAALTLMDAAIASALNMAAAAGGFVFWRAYLRRGLGEPGAAHGEHRRALRESVRRQAPNCIYYVLNGQLAVWLVGMFGSAEKIADVGALGRLGAGFAVIMSLVTTLAMPYFARNQQPSQLESGFVALNAFFAALLGVLTAAALLAPAPILWVLGPHYAGLGAELVWMVLATALASWGGALYVVACARGWVLPAPLGIACGVLATIAGVSLFDLSSVAGVLELNTLTAFVTVVVNGGYLATCLWRHRRLDAPGLGKAAT